MNFARCALTPCLGRESILIGDETGLLKPDKCRKRHMVSQQGCGKQNKLIGKIILSNFLEHSAERFITFVRDIEGALLYRKLVRQGVIMPKFLPEARILRRKDAAALGAWVTSQSRERNSQIIKHNIAKSLRNKYLMASQEVELTETIMSSSRDPSS